MRTWILSAALAALCLPMRPALAQDKDKDNVNPEEIVRKFAAKEAEFKEARGNYMYRQSVKLEELDAGGNPIDNDDEGLAVAQAVTACGQWLATPDPNQQDPATAAAEAQIVANNKDMATFRMDWIRRANPFHTRGHDTSTDNWVEILHFEAGVSYATVPNT